MLARTQAAFNAAFPGVPVFAEFGVNLSVTQTLALVRTNGALGQVINAVRFDNAPPWVSVATGQSLQLLDMAQATAAANWGVSAAVPTTPARPIPLRRFCPRLIRVGNEVQYITTGFVDNFGESSPWIELYKSGAVPVVSTNIFWLTISRVTYAMALSSGTTLQRANAK